MKIVLWLLQLGLAAMFVTPGIQKLTVPYAELAANEPWVEPYSPVMIVLIGCAELLGVVGLILPAATRILPVLTPLAATGLGVTMIGAGITNLAVGEPGYVWINLVLLIVAGIVAWGRFGPYAIADRRTRAVPQE